MDSACPSLKWPGVIKPSTIINDIMSSEDWMPTLLAAAGEPDVKEKLLTGQQGWQKTFKNHLDGYNFVPFFKGEVAEGPRHEFFYFSDNADLNALRYDAWKISFKTIEGNLYTGKEESTNVPLVTNLRPDPWERYQPSQCFTVAGGAKSCGRWFLPPNRRTIPRDVQGIPAQPGGGIVRHRKGAQMLEAGSRGGGK